MFVYVSAWRTKYGTEQVVTIESLIPRSRWDIHIIGYKRSHVLIENARIFSVHSRQNGFLWEQRGPRRAPAIFWINLSIEHGSHAKIHQQWQ